MKFLVLDNASSPPCIVLQTDDEEEMLRVATKYAAQTNRNVTCVQTSRYESLMPETAAIALTFATRDDAIRAGMPNAPVADSSDRRETGKTAETADDKKKQRS